MKLAKGADVVNTRGEKLGTLHRVIIDPQTKDVTHIVVEKGWLFTTQKVISIHQIDAAVQDQITVRGTDKQLEDLPVFEESQYVTLDHEDHPELPVEGSYWYPPLNFVWWRAGGTDNPIMYPDMPTYVLRTNQNIPEGTVALQEGAKVVSKDEKGVGSIEQVIVDPQDNRATHVVVGGLFTERKLVPVLWISSLDEKEVHLSVSSHVLERLPEYNVDTR